MATHATTLAWGSHGQRRLVGHSPCSHEETDSTEQLIHTPHYKTFSHRIHESFSNPNMLCKQPHQSNEAGTDRIY